MRVCSMHGFAAVSGQVGCQCKCLRRADFADTRIATQEIEAFMLSFEWRKGVRFYKRLKDKIAARSALQLAP